MLPVTMVTMRRNHSKSRLTPMFHYVCALGGSLLLQVAPYSSPCQLIIMYRLFLLFLLFNPLPGHDVTRQCSHHIQ